MTKLTSSRHRTNTKAETSHYSPPRRPFPQETGNRRVKSNELEEQMLCTRSGLEQAKAASDFQMTRERKLNSRISIEWIRERSQAESGGPSGRREARNEQKTSHAKPRSRRHKSMKEQQRERYRGRHSSVVRANSRTRVKWAKQWPKQEDRVI